MWKRKELWRRGNKDRVGMMWPKGRLKVVGERERETESERETEKHTHGRFSVKFETEAEWARRGEGHGVGVCKCHIKDTLVAISSV